MCNNLLDCIEKESTEKNESFNYNDYENNEIKTTQNPAVYNQSYRDYGWELANDGVCPKFCMQCKSNTDCERCAPLYVFLDGQCVKDNNCETFGFDGYSDETNEDGSVVENEKVIALLVKMDIF
jgi:hypothetical protein